MQDSTSAISNLALKVTDVLSCNKEFNVSSFIKSDRICDSIKKQWIHYQLEEIAEDFFLKIKDGL